MRSCETTRAAPCLRLNTCPQSGNQRLRARASAAERRTRTPTAPAVVGDAVPARDPNSGPRFDHVRAGRENRSARDDRRGREAIGGMMVSPGMLPGLGRCRARRCENRYGAKRKHEYLRFHGRYPLQSGTPNAFLPFRVPPEHSAAISGSSNHKPETDARFQPFSRRRRARSRCQLRCFSVSRLSCSFLPRATASSIFARPLGLK